MKHTLPIATLLAALLCSFQAAFAVDLPDSSTLLWKISGNGLAKPSYLYGTMHLRDSRIFDFADSVMPIFNACPGFAMESLPDSAAALFMESTSYTLTLPTPLEDSTIQALLPSSDDGAFLRSVRRSWHTDMSLWNKRVQYPTILDFYLYRMARASGKVVSPLESISEVNRRATQALHEQTRRELENIDTESEIGRSRTPSLVEIFRDISPALFMSKAIRLYRDGRIDDLLAVADVSFGGAKDILLIERNLNMVKSMQRLMRERPTFITAGTAHLPGKGGLIDLLRAAGYTVTPVPQTRQLPRPVLNDDLMEAQWYTYNQPGTGYSVELPARPFHYPLAMFRNASMEFNTVIYPDITSNITYIATYTDVLKKRPQREINALIDSCTASMLAGKEAPYLATEEALDTDTVPMFTGEAVPQFAKEEILKDKIYNFYGKRMEMWMPDSTYRTVQLCSHAGRVFLLMAIAPSDTLYPAEVRRFFSTFTTTALPAAKPTVFRSTSGAYSLSLPDKPAIISGMPRLSWLGDTTATCVDRKTGIFYRSGLATINPVELSELTPYASSYSMQAAFHIELPEVEMLVADSTAPTGSVFNCVVPGDNDTVRARFVQRGGRIHYVLADIPEGVPVSASDAVFKSFKLLDFAPSTSVEKVDVDSLHFSASMPGVDKDNWLGIDYSDYGAYTLSEARSLDSLWFAPHINKATIDPNSGSVFRLSVITFGKYFYAENLDSLLSTVETGDHVISSYLNSAFTPKPSEEEYFTADEELSDTVAIAQGSAVESAAEPVAEPTVEPLRTVRSFTVGSFPGRISITKGPGTFRRYIAIVLRGNTMYSLAAIGSSDKSDSLMFERYVASLKIAPGAVQTTIYTPKTSEMLADIRSGAIAKPNELVHRYTFTAADLPELYRTLQTPMADDDSYEGTRLVLLQNLALIADSTTLPFLVDLIPALDSFPLLQQTALSAVAQAESREAAVALAALLPKLPESTLNEFDKTQLLPICRTPEYAKILLPTLLAFADKNDWQSIATEVIREMYTSDSITVADVRPARDFLYKSLIKHLEMLRAINNAPTEEPIEPGVEAPPMIVEASSSETSDMPATTDEYDGYATEEPPYESLSAYEIVDAAVREINLLALFRDDRNINDTLMQLLHDTTLGGTTAIALLQNGRELNLADYPELTATTRQTIDLYRVLDRTGFGTHFPKQPHSQEDIAKALAQEYLYDYMAASDSGPELRIVDTRDITEGSHAGRYYLLAALVPVQAPPSDETIIMTEESSIEQPSEEQNNSEQIVEEPSSELPVEKQWIVMLCGPQPFDKKRIAPRWGMVYSESTPLQEDNVQNQFTALIEAAQAVMEEE